MSELRSTVCSFGDRLRAFSWLQAESLVDVANDLKGQGVGSQDALIKAFYPG